MDWLTLHDALYSFLSILLEGAFFIFVGTLLSGFIDAYMPSHLLDKYLPKNPFVAILAGGALGAIFPVCECAIVPVIRRLIKKGLPVSVAVTYMLAAPIVNPVTILSTVAAFSERGGQGLFIAGSRVGIAYAITVLVGLLVLKAPLSSILQSWVIPKTKKKEGDEESATVETSEEATREPQDQTEGKGESGEEEAVSGKLVHALRVAQRDFTDVAMYFVFGVALTALFNVWTDRDVIEPVAENTWLAAPAMMILAFVLSLCSTSDAFVAAAIDKFSYGAKMAFMIYGPMMDLKLIFLYSTVLRPKFVLWLGLGLFVLVWIACGLWGSLPMANPASS
ncbi:MAG: permease [Verrucomicrobiota bacterium]